MPAAGHAGQGTLARRGDADDGGLGAERLPAAGDGGLGHVAGRRGGRQSRAQLVQVQAALEADELGEREPCPLDRLGRGAGDGDEEAPVGLRMSRSSSQCTTTAPMVRSETTRGRWPGRGTGWLDGGHEVGSLPPEIFEGLGEHRHVASRRGPARRGAATAGPRRWARQGRSRSDEVCAGRRARPERRRSRRRPATRRAGRRRRRRPPGPDRPPWSGPVPCSACAGRLGRHPPPPLVRGSPNGPSTAARCAGRAGRTIHMAIPVAASCVTTRGACGSARRSCAGVC